jgi:hypothetical protein
MLGTLYFLLGLVVSGASVVPEFLPTWLASSAKRSHQEQGRA